MHVILALYCYYAKERKKIRVTCCRGYKDQKDATRPCHRASQNVHMERLSGTKRELLANGKDKTKC
jgi:hypothetical protein